MKTIIRYIQAITCMIAANAFAADIPKTKVLDNLNAIDPRTLQFREARAKIVNTQDSEHGKALELVMDYRKPDISPAFFKTFLPRTIDPQKYVAIRYWVRSDSETQYNITLTGSIQRKDGKHIVFGANHPPTTATWTQVTIPFVEFRRGSEKSFKNGTQEVTPGVDDQPDADDFENFVKLGFGSIIDWRGKSTNGHLMFDRIELVEK
ncbi:MAG: hypothetical protein WCO60_09520 [Verrucomicrobiota bacterium]